MPAGERAGRKPEAIHIFPKRLFGCFLHRHLPPSAQFDVSFVTDYGSILGTHELTRWFVTCLECPTCLSAALSVHTITHLLFASEESVTLPQECIFPFLTTGKEEREAQKRRGSVAQPARAFGAVIRSVMKPQHTYVPYPQNHAASMPDSICHAQRAFR